MSVFKDIEGYEDSAIKICPAGSEGEIVELGNLIICLPAQPKKKEIYGWDKKKELQMWDRVSN